MEEGDRRGGSDKIGEGLKPSLLLLKMEEGISLAKEHLQPPEAETGKE